MAFFSFLLLKNLPNNQLKKFSVNQKYYSKDITLWKQLNNINKQEQIFILKNEKRIKLKSLGKKLLICLPPKFGLGDAIEYSIGIKSLINSKKFKKIGLAFCSNQAYIFKNLFSFCHVYPQVISDCEFREYDTIFHLTLEIDALKFQKYSRSNISLEICKHFDVELFDIKISNKNKLKKNKKIITIFPISTSVIRSLPLPIVDSLVSNLKNEFEFEIIIDNSSYSKHLEENSKKNSLKFIKPKNIEDLIEEIKKVDFGIFVDSGPLHLAKIFDIHGVLLETSVSEKILLSNSKNIYAIKNYYNSKYCSGPCGLVDIFSYNNHIGCYETNQVSFDKIKNVVNFKNLQRFNKKENNTHFIFNPVGCIREISVNNILKFLKDNLKEKL